MLKQALMAALTLLLATLLFFLGALGPAAAVHLAFAAGTLPLIFGAMLHFVPVLTRTGSPVRAIRLLPWGAQFVGLVLVLTLHGLLPRATLPLWAVLDMLAAALLLGWMIQRAQRCLGRPHPGWRWYASALGMLLLALLAIVLMSVWPEHYTAFYRAHLHLNTLGLIGLAALGTLPVLLPTVMHQPDTQASLWLRRALPLCGTGGLCIALGSARFWPLAGLGSVLLAWPLVRLLWRWWQLYRQRLWQDGAALPLCTASLMLLALLLSAPWLHGRGVIAAFLIGVLLPLVTGSLSQLLPIWRYPGPVTPARLALRQRLTAGGQWRAAGFGLGGIGCLADTLAAGGLLAMTGLLCGVWAAARYRTDSQSV